MNLLYITYIIARLHLRPVQLWCRCLFTCLREGIGSFIYITSYIYDVKYIYLSIFKLRDKMVS